MGPQVMARLFAGRLHYSWVVLVVMFVVILASVGVRATPGVLIVPLLFTFMVASYVKPESVMPVTVKV